MQMRLPEVVKFYQIYSECRQRGRKSGQCGRDRPYWILWQVHPMDFMPFTNSSDREGSVGCANESMVVRRGNCISVVFGASNCTFIARLFGLIT